MTIEHVKDPETGEYPSYPRHGEIKSIMLCGDGYSISAAELCSLITEKLPEVPEQYREGAGINGPDEYGSEYTISWHEPEADDVYEARVAAAMERASKEATDRLVRAKELAPAIYIRLQRQLAEAKAKLEALGLPIPEEGA